MMIQPKVFEPAQNEDIPDLMTLDADLGWTSLPLHSLLTFSLSRRV